ncbi:MAG: HAD family hydrolase [Anaerolineales bacterium]
MNNKFLIAFDYDGVLADSLDHNLLVAEQACRHLGLSLFPTQKDIEQLENMSFKDIGRQIKVPENQIKDFTDFIFDRLEREPNTLSIFEGIAELLLQLSKQHTLVVVTTNTQKVVERFLNKHGLEKCFARIMGDEWQGSKHEKIIQAAQQFNFEKHSVYLAGDTISDIREARLAGINSIAVSWGYQSRSKLLEESPNFFADTPQDILDIFEAISS